MNCLMLLFKDIHYDARVQREAIALAEAGHKVYIACLREYEETPPTLHNNIDYIRCSILTKRVKRSVAGELNENGLNKVKKFILKAIRNPGIKILKDVFANREFYKYVKKEIKRLNINVIHCHDLNTLPAGFYLSKKHKTRLVYDSHELFNEMAGKNIIERKAGYIVESYLIKRINHLIVVNPFVEEEFSKRYGFTNTTVIQNTPILPSRKDIEIDKINYWRTKYNLKNSDTILLYQGGLTPQRGLEESIYAMSLLPVNYKLIFLGQGRLIESLEKLTWELGLNDRVFFHEQVSPNNILWYTKQADIGLVMYKNTCKNNFLSTPNKIFEYMLAGIPVVSSNHPGKQYIVDVAQTGVCVDESPEAIKEGIERVIKRYPYYKTNCLVEREKYCWQVERKKLIKLYNQFGG